MSVETLMADGDRDDYIMLGLADAQDFANNMANMGALDREFTDQDRPVTTQRPELTTLKDDLTYTAGVLATRHTFSGGIRSGVLPGPDYWLG